MLMERVKRRISDRRVLKLLRRWLKAGVMEDGKVSNASLGTPQGGVISPLLANIYLGALDGIWERQCRHLGVLVRYADDFVVLCRTQAQANEALRRLRDHRGTAAPDATSGEDADRRARARQAGIRLPGLLSEAGASRTSRSGRICFGGLLRQRWNRIRARIRTDGPSAQGRDERHPGSHPGAQSGPARMGQLLLHGECIWELPADRPLRAPPAQPAACSTGWRS